jgi:hypothetical protein
MRKQFHRLLDLLLDIIVIVPASALYISFMSFGFHQIGKPEQLVGPYTLPKTLSISIGITIYLLYVFYIGWYLKGHHK